jgi:hypothetical protein
MIMANYVIAYRVPADYKPADPKQWQDWFGGLGDSLVDVGRAVTDYASAGEVGGSDSHFVAYSVINADSLDDALAIAKTCPVMSVGGGVEVGPQLMLPGE